MSEGAFARTGGAFVLRLGPDERAVLRRLLGELRTLLVQDDHGATPALRRLFPVVHPEDAELEAEYQRLMREELVASRIAAISTVDAALEGTGSSAPPSFDEEQLLAFMQAVNGVRLVLGTLLGVTDDDPGDGDFGDDGVDDDTGALAPERHLYAFLSWLLDSAVAALSPGTAF